MYIFQFIIQSLLDQYPELVSLVRKKRINFMMSMKVDHILPLFKVFFLINHSILSLDKKFQTRQ